MSDPIYRVDLRSPAFYNGSYSKGVKVVSILALRRGERITVALGQRGSPTDKGNGCGGSFLVRETKDGPQPLLIAGGPGADESGQLGQAGSGNQNIGSSGVQQYLEGDRPDFYCAGAGFLSAPRVQNLDERSKAPATYAQGLTGGTGINYNGKIMEGGFGGGGAHFYSASRKFYFGAGGGYTGGAHRRSDRWMYGGGGGSFSTNRDAQFSHHQETTGSCKIELLPS